MPNKNKRSKGAKTKRAKASSNEDGRVISTSATAFTNLPIKFGRIYVETLAFHSQYNITEAAAGAGSFQTFRLNSIFDPDFTGVGSLAIPYTTWQNFFTRYRVLKVDFDVRFVNRNGGINVVGMFPTMQSTYSATANTWPVQPHSYFTTLNGSAGATQSQARFTGTFDLAKIAMIPYAQYRLDNDYAAPFGSNPAIPVYLNVWQRGTGAVESVQIIITLRFHVQLYSALESLSA